VIQIKKINLESKNQIKKFIMFEWEIYKGDKTWVPPLIMDMKAMFDPKKNPFHDHSRVQPFLAYKENKIVGRITAIINDNHNKAWNEKTGFFGFFESINDQEIANALLNSACSWIKDRGMDTVRGPANFSSNDTWGLLIDNFKMAPMILMTYNPPYYKKLIEQYGFEKVKDVFAYKMESKDGIMPERVKKVAQHVLNNKDIVIRTINMKKFDREVNLIKKIYNGAWEKNWGFVPMTDEEFKHLAKELKPIAEPKFVLIAEVNGEPAGFSLCASNANEALIKINGRLFPFGLFKLLYYVKKIKTVRLITLGVLDKFRKKGIEGAFYYKSLMTGKELGIDWGECSWILEDNVLMNRGIELMGGKIYKTYRIYDYKL